MIALLLCLGAMVSTQEPRWTLTFDDEFDGPKGTAPSTSRWARDLGGRGFGNNEMESYTDGSANAFLDGEGHLVIEARKESTTGADHITKPYSSARLITNGKFSQKYGKIEARIKIPRGQGIWPAFWMLGADIGTAGWPGCGEIDILESIGPEAKIAYGTLHGPGYSGGNGIQGRYHSEASLADDYHVYGVEWRPGSIKWFVDGNCYSTVTPDQTHGHPWVFDQPFFIILNLAVGGYWPGYPDATTTFPQRMLVDYVRAYEKSVSR